LKIKGKSKHSLNSGVQYGTRV